MRSCNLLESWGESSSIKVNSSGGGGAPLGGLGVIPLDFIKLMNCPGTSQSVSFANKEMCCLANFRNGTN
jgi:hypothetical protein